MSLASDSRIRRSALLLSVFFCLALSPYAQEILLPLKPDSMRFAVIGDTGTGSKAQYQVGQELTVSLFEVGGTVDVVGVSKGRGFAGVIRRHHFTCGRETHGCVTHKQPGSIGASAYPSRVIKGKRLPGRMGGARVTVKNLAVVGVDPDQHLIWIRGSIPGPPTSTVMIRKNG